MNSQIEYTDGIFLIDLFPMYGNNYGETQTLFSVKHLKPNGIVNT